MYCFFLHTRLTLHITTPDKATFTILLQCHFLRFVASLTTQQVTASDLHRLGVTDSSLGSQRPPLPVSPTESGVGCVFRVYNVFARGWFNCLRFSYQGFTIIGYFNLNCTIKLFFNSRPNTSERGHLSPTGFKCTRSRKSMTFTHTSHIQLNSLKN